MRRGGVRLVFLRHQSEQWSKVVQPPVWKPHQGNATLLPAPEVVIVGGIGAPYVPAPFSVSFLKSETFSVCLFFS